MDRRSLLGALVCLSPSSGCLSTGPSELEELAVEVRNRTAERKRVAVRLEHRDETVYSAPLNLEGGATVERTTGVTSHPLTVRATVDGTLEDVAAYEWHGCEYDRITVEVNPRPGVLSGCYDD
jgi:hypothetical protein